ncbi:hypothetical protein JCM11641_000308 [Rhodosporidiobolus odoratus]
MSSESLKRILDIHNGAWTWWFRRTYADTRPLARQLFAIIYPTKASDELDIIVSHVFDSYLSPYNPVIGMSCIWQMSNSMPRTLPWTRRKNVAVTVVVVGLVFVMSILPLNGDAPEVFDVHFLENLGVFRYPVFYFSAPLGFCLVFIIWTFYALLPFCIFAALNFLIYIAASYSLLLLVGSWASICCDLISPGKSSAKLHARRLRDLVLSFEKADSRFSLSLQALDRFNLPLESDEMLARRLANLRTPWLVLCHNAEAEPQQTSALYSRFLVSQSAKRYCRSTYTRSVLTPLPSHLEHYLAYLQRAPDTEEWQAVQQAVGQIISSARWLAGVASMYILPLHRLRHIRQPVTRKAVLSLFKRFTPPFLTKSEPTALSPDEVEAILGPFLQNCDDFCTLVEPLQFTIERTRNVLFTYLDVVSAQTLAVQAEVASHNAILDAVLAWKTRKDSMAALRVTQE